MFNRLSFAFSLVVAVALPAAAQDLCAGQPPGICWFINDNCAHCRPERHAGKSALCRITAPASAAEGVTWQAALTSPAQHACGKDCACCCLVSYRNGQRTSKQCSVGACADNIDCSHCSAAGRRRTMPAGAAGFWQGAGAAPRMPWPPPRVVERDAVVVPGSVASAALTKAVFAISEDQTTITDFQYEAVTYRDGLVAYAVAFEVENNRGERDSHVVLTDQFWAQQRGKRGETLSAAAIKPVWFDPAGIKTVRASMVYAEYESGPVQGAQGNCMARKAAPSRQAALAVYRRVLAVIEASPRKDVAALKRILTAEGKTKGLSADSSAVLRDVWAALGVGPSGVETAVSMLRRFSAVKAPERQ